RGCPVSGTVHVAFPERPRPALSRPHGIDSAARLAVVEHAIAVGPLFERPAMALAASVEAGHFFQWFGAELGNRPDLIVRPPDEAGRAGAAVSAPRASKAQAVGVPGLRHKHSSTGSCRS